MKLLIHICCGPCSIYPVRVLRDDRHEVMGFFYRSNIHPFTECLRREETKSGIDAAEAIELLTRIGTLKNIRVKGLMTMPPFFDQPDKARPYFRQLARLRDRIVEARIAGVKMEELSMGMTGDFEVAIAEGATLVRIGTAIFGSRQ